jgi:hypothetical protein
MTTFQMISLGVLGLVLFGQFVLPNLKLQAKKPSTMKQIEQVILIKESSANPKVIDACSQLLQALLG